MLSTTVSQIPSVDYTFPRRPNKVHVLPSPPQANDINVPTALRTSRQLTLIIDRKSKLSPEGAHRSNASNTKAVSAPICRWPMRLFFLVLYA